MADEATITSGLRILKRDANNVIILDYPNKTGQTFSVDVTGTKGPTPGALTIPTGGKVVSLEELVTPGLYRFTNMDSASVIEYGIYLPDFDLFVPWGEMLPGETYVGRFSRNLLEDYPGTGTGTDAAHNRVFMKSYPSDAVCNIEAFEA